MLGHITYRFSEEHMDLDLENKNIENVYKNIFRKRQHKAIYDQYPEPLRISL